MIAYGWIYLIHIEAIIAKKLLKTLQKQTKNKYRQFIWSEIKLIK